MGSCFLFFFLEICLVNSTNIARFFTVVFSYFKVSIVKVLSIFKFLLKIKCSSSRLTSISAVGLMLFQCNLVLVGEIFRRWNFPSVKFSVGEMGRRWNFCRWNVPKPLQMDLHYSRTALNQFLNTIQCIKYSCQ
jgi:hypothetical protein